MHDEVIAFLGAYTPRSICAECLAAVMQQETMVVTNRVNSHVVRGRVESGHGECLNCGVRRTVYRRAA
jgi:hypothetical protein